MKILRTLLLFTAVVALAACSKLTQDNLDKVKPGMSPDEVKAILGDPTNSQSGNLLNVVSGTTYTYHTDKSDVTITFVNDKVTTIQGNFQ